MSVDILGIIPARGGSKGVPRKNIKSIAGKPLIAWTIEKAAKSTLIDKFVVSTEDQEITNIALEYGAETILRPGELATDETSTLSVLQHAMGKIHCNTIVLLQPTSPIRYDGLIDECINEFIEKGCDSLATGFMCDYVEYGKNNLRRQDIQGFFYDDGNVYVIKAENVRNGDWFGEKIYRKIIDKWQNIEIDDECDFWITEQILSNKNI